MLEKVRAGFLGQAIGHELLRVEKSRELRDRLRIADSHTSIRN
jgi:hypothetical protein